MVKAWLATSLSTLCTSESGLARLAQLGLGPRYEIIPCPSASQSPPRPRLSSSSSSNFEIWIHSITSYHYLRCPRLRFCTPVLSYSRLNIEHPSDSYIEPPYDHHRQHAFLSPARPSPPTPSRTGSREEQRLFGSFAGFFGSLVRTVCRRQAYIFRHQSSWSRRCSSHRCCCEPIQ